MSEVPLQGQNSVASPSSWICSQVDAGASSTRAVAGTLLPNACVTQHLKIFLNGGLGSYIRRESNQNISGDKLYYTACSLLLR